MVAQELTRKLGERFPALPIQEVPHPKTGCHLHIEAAAENIAPLAQFFLDEGFFLESLSGVDWVEKFQVTYHFNRFDETLRVMAKVSAPAANPVVPTVSHIFPSANWFEREACEMYGIDFKGHPNLARLILPEFSTNHPLRKNYKFEGDVQKEVAEMIELEAAVQKLISPTVEAMQTRDYFVNMGPQHPSTHGVLRVILHMEGERLLGAEPVVGYAHRADEKMAEIGNYLQFWPNTGRVDYLCALLYNWGWAGIVEKAQGIVVPPRAEYIRVITAELNRITSHLLWLGTFMLDLGAFTPFLYCFADREKALDLLEAVTGERITFVYFKFGGVLYDLPPDFIPQTRAFIKIMRKHLKDYHDLITKNIIFLNRTKGVGVITKEVARLYGATGPVARGSGIYYDIRKKEPYSVYKEMDFEVPLGENGDCWDRYMVRMLEMEQSLRLIEQGCDKIKEGPIETAEAPKRIKPEKGEYYQAIESGRGEFGIYLVSDGGVNPYRVKLRTPCFSNLSLLPAISQGILLADLVAILGSLDLVIPDVDR